MTGLERVVLSAIVILASIFPVEWLPIGLQLLHGTDGRLTGKQGEVLVVHVPVDDHTAAVEGRFLGRTIHFAPELREGQSPRFVGLLGIDLEDKPGTYEMAVDVRLQDRQKTLAYTVSVLKERFAVEQLKLPKSKVDLDKKALERYQSEQQAVREALSTDSAERLWLTNFIEPVEGRTSGRFGSVRILNGQRKNPHRGEDIAAPAGRDVVASNDGIVRLTVDHIFSGKGIYLDHGLGIYSLYFHLSEILVQDGEAVKAGQVIGKVGSTGRATGPHLHWGAKVGGAWVNPFSLVKLALGTSKTAEPSPTGQSSN